MRVLRGIALGAAVAAAVLILAEAATRCLAPAAAPSVADLDDWVEYEDDLGWVLRPGFDGDLYGGHRVIAASGLLACDQPKLERRKGRLALALGDSCTFGNGVDTVATYPEILSRRLAGWDVLNLAVPGHSSFQGLRTLERQVPRLHPDAVIFAFGFNDRRYVLRPEDVDSAGRFSRLARAAGWRGWGRHSALVGWLARQGAAAGGPIREPLDLEPLRARVEPREYRGNLAAAARFCRTRKIPLILLVLCDHPGKSGLLRRALAELRQGSRGEAERDLRAAIALGNELSDAARRSLAILLAGSGRAQEAARIALSPRTLRSVAGGFPIYGDPEYRALALEMGSEPGARVIDAGPLLDEHPEWFLDAVHFNADAHGALADRLAPELSAMIPGDGERAPASQR